MNKTLQHDRSDDGLPPEVSLSEQVILARLDELHLTLNEEFRALHAEVLAAAKAAGERDRLRREADA